MKFAILILLKALSSYHYTCINSIKAKNKKFSKK